MTPHEQTIRAHCAERGIQIREYPSGTIRFIGHTVDVSVAAWKHATIESLTSYQPRRKRLARAEFTDLPDLGGFGL
ncbi:MAG: hypothetical protein J0H16_07375 [Alicycliphilus denitrificans]|nr:hypothetical protein [Alicycliphilus denitrificans]OJW90436.1 MAG: hypothetical protein BGO66_05470 [Alicycliphilus sp. 69-12]